jgi:hypothetical protein
MIYQLYRADAGAQPSRPLITLHSTFLRLEKWCKLKHGNDHSKSWDLAIRVAGHAKYKDVSREDTDPEPAPGSHLPKGLIERAVDDILRVAKASVLRQRLTADEAIQQVRAAMLDYLPRSPLYPSLDFEYLEIALHEASKTPERLVHNTLLHADGTEWPYPEDACAQDIPQADKTKSPLPVSGSVSPSAGIANGIRFDTVSYTKQIAL